MPMKKVGCHRLSERLVEQHVRKVEVLFWDPCLFVIHRWCLYLLSYCVRISVGTGNKMVEYKIEEQGVGIYT